MAKHTHQIWGTIDWVLDTDTLSIQTGKCLCGVELIRHTTPLGTKPNWTDWQVN